MVVFNSPGDCNQDGTVGLSDVVHLLGGQVDPRREETLTDSVVDKLLDSPRA